MNFIGFELVGLNCPRFTGVEDHGQKLTLDLDDKLRDRFHAYCEGTASCHVHQDGTIYITTMDYNYSAEEYQEEIIKDLTHDIKFRTELDKWLRAHPLYCSHQFPYRVSADQDFWGCDMICNSLDSLIKYLKNY